MPVDGNDWGVAFDEALIQALGLDVWPHSETRLVSLFANGIRDPVLVAFSDDQAKGTMCVAALGQKIMGPMAIWWDGDRHSPPVLGPPDWHLVKIDKKTVREIRRQIGFLDAAPTGGIGSGRDGMGVTTWLWKGGRCQRHIWCSFGAPRQGPDVALLEALLRAIEKAEAFDVGARSMLKSLKEQG